MKRRKLRRERQNPSQHCLGGCTSARKTLKSSPRIATPRHAVSSVQTLAEVVRECAQQGRGGGRRDDHLFVGDTVKGRVTRVNGRKECRDGGGEESEGKRKWTMQKGRYDAHLFVLKCCQRRGTSECREVIQGRPRRGILNGRKEMGRKGRDDAIGTIRCSFVCREILSSGETRVNGGKECRDGGGEES